MEINHHIASFLLKNGFSKHKIGDNIYYNSECTITVLDACYKITFKDLTTKITFNNNTFPNITFN